MDAIPRFRSVPSVGHAIHRTGRIGCIECGAEADLQWTHHTIGWTEHQGTPGAVTTRYPDLDGYALLCRDRWACILRQAAEEL